MSMKAADAEKVRSRDLTAVSSGENICEKAMPVFRDPEEDLQGILDFFKVCLTPPSSPGLHHRPPFGLSWSNSAATDFALINVPMRPLRVM